MKAGAFLLTLLFAITTSALADPLDYAKIWKNWGTDAQHAYVWGVMDGGGRAMVALIIEAKKATKEQKKQAEELSERIRLKTAILHDQTKLVEVMTALYADPANSYIDIQDMLYIARDSISGQDVRKRILAARKYATDNTRFDEREE